ncbi:uncharacterized protein LOC107849628 [Capsicum annuum]|uniref:uncharacterized protein LOC107849628 n=1 Tax=Capsicum annuum TaxID=4072 RepID=UPI0007BFEA67|nr:uncharacterized protein LOC107849628 [Capsicum annuum]
MIFEWLFLFYGLLQTHQPKAAVFYCGLNCGCRPTCVNRTSQKRLRYRLEETDQRILRRRLIEGQSIALMLSLLAMFRGLLITRPRWSDKANKTSIVIVLVNRECQFSFFHELFV